MLVVSQPFLFLIQVFGSRDFFANQQEPLLYFFFFFLFFLASVQRQETETAVIRQPANV